VSADWGELYRAIFPDLVRFLHRKVWDLDRARDLAQEAFVRALEHEPRKPKPWLYQVASNLARDEARTVVRRKRHLALLKSEAEDLQGSVGDSADELDRREQWRKVQEALDGLGERDREALLLWDAGLSYPDIARQTGLAVASVGTTLARARRKLAEVYREKEGTDVARG
jgi:RNA polymerase sigma-70 factor (ECF subfamily)